MLLCTKAWEVDSNIYTNDKWTHSQKILAKYFLPWQVLIIIEILSKYSIKSYFASKNGYYQKTVDLDSLYIL